MRPIPSLRPSAMALVAIGVAVVAWPPTRAAAQAQAQAQKPLAVVVTIKPVHALALQVLDGVAKPTLVVDGNASPHTYALKPSDAKAMNDADLLLRVSERLEPFTAKVVRTLPKTVRVVTLEEAPGMKRLPRRTGATFDSHDHAGHGHKGHGHGHGGKKSAGEAMDGHVWLDPANAKAIVAHIAKVVGELRPAAAPALQANAAKALARLDALDTELAGLLKPVAGRPYVVFHDALQYLEVRYGLTPAGSITTDPEVPPSGKRLADLRRKVGTLKAACVFSEPNFEARVTAAITEGTSAKTAQLDPEGALVPAGPDMYDALMRGVARSLAGCLAPQS